jgi:predicted DNA-binding transcriptional regulator YafY
MAQVLNHSKATGRAKLVLLGIANHQGDQGAWPSIATLARYANASERSVKRDIADLVQLGELIVEVNAAPVDSQYKTNLYWVTVAGVTDSASGVTNQVIRGDRLGQSGGTQGGTQNINKTFNETKAKNAFSLMWQPAPEELKKLQDQYPNADLDGEVQLMIDYLLATGKERQVKDMSARFRTWMRNADKFAKGALSKPTVDEWFVKPEDRIS